MKKYFLILIILLITGCKNYNELNDLAIIKNIGIKYDNNYTLYALIIDEINKDNVPKTKIIETSGKTINEVFENIKLIINKEIYLSHIDLIILDENINNKNLKEIINYFLHHKEFRNDFLTVISDNIKDVLEKSKYDEIENIIITNRDSKKIIKISFEEVMQHFLDNNTLYISKIIFKDKLSFNGNYKYVNNKFERINNEKNRT